MTGLELILEQIGSDAKQEADEQLAAAQEKADGILQAAKEEAARQAAAVIEKGEGKAQSIRERAESAAQLERRNSMLSFKQQMIREAIDSAFAQLESAPDEEYFHLLLQLVAHFAPDGASEMRLNKKDLERLPAGFAGELKKAAPRAEITVSSTPCDIGSGFLLVCGGVDINCTLQAIFEGAEGELRDAAGKILFPNA